ncbi:unnamed protein product [Symbiodinium natans]|uniref:Reverse transcriptase Ty1/copia-type domain-containing protein n=1 Tax=Symbiodinium natans TaxID=878477 RepID=A0A812ICG3_9DINO|nr:unnamed protein product [Symbiodinium natans]
MFEIPIGFEADEQSDLLDGMQLGLKRLGLHEQQKLQQDLWDQSSLDEEPDTWTLKDQVTQVRAIHEQADQVEDDLRLLKSMSVETNVGGTGAPTDVFPEVFLQTKTIQQAQVLQELPAWTPAVSAEYNTIRHEKAAIEPITEQQIRVMEEDDSLIVKRIPAKMVFTRKAVSGQRKARACACGNFLQAGESSKTKQELREEVYAAGIDITVLRTMLAVGARRGWKAGTTDIKGAFLNAPLLQRTKTKTERIILDPPKILSRAGIIPPYEKWLVTRALYGLDISPKSWAVFRNQQLNGRRFLSGGAWQACRTDQNLWRILSEDGKLCGLVSIYIDDILGVMEDGVLQSCFSDLSQLWACSTPQYVAQGSVRFCGFDISEGSDDRRGFLLRQEAYIDEILERFESEHQGSLRTSREMDPLQVKLAQKLIGELNWIGTRTRPDIIFAISKAAQCITRDAVLAVEAATQIFKFLKATKEEGLRYVANPDSFGKHQELRVPRKEALVEVFTDASHAPDAGRSQECVHVFAAGQLIGWSSNKQTMTSLSTAESELCAVLEGVAYGEGTKCVLEEILQVPVQAVIYCDNAATVALVTGSSNLWRTRGLKITMRYLADVSP